jgi:Zn-dependent peptidase ImmA (M78 family)
VKAGWLDEAVKASKLRASPRKTFPRELAKEVELHLPVYLVSLPGLTCHQVRDWLAQKNSWVQVPDVDRKIHGCMVAEKDRGFIFLRADDPVEVLRFTLAHEVAHFVLDHLLPRTRALAALGERIRPVLDGEDEPNIEEGLSAMFKRIPLSHARLMDRGASGNICLGSVDESEHRADRLAYELLAPADRALPLLKGLPRAQGVAELETRFGLPSQQATAYARILLGPEHRPFSIAKYFPEEED